MKIYVLSLVLAIAFPLAPAQAAPHLLGSVRGVGNAETSSLYLGGAFFPGRGWRDDAQSKMALHAGTRWQSFGLFGPGPNFTTGAILPPDMPAGVVVNARQALPQSDDLIAIANVGPAAQPRLPRAQNLDAPLYQRAAATLLRARGSNVQSANLHQLLRVDLNGDGADEVLMAARSRPDYGHTSETRRGDYALVALRFVDGGKVVTVPLDVDVAPKNVAFGAPPAFQIGCCVDADGDGKMEIFVKTDYYEGWGFEVWRFDGHGVKRVLQAGWGV